MNAPVSPVMKPWVEGIAPYVPGKSALGSRPVVAKLSSNENPFGASPQAIAAMTAVLGKTHLYPDPASTALREAIGALHGLEPERIICGTGSDELIHLVAGAYAGLGDEVLYVRHGFAVYDIAARRVGATPVIAPDVDYTCDVDAVLAAVTPRTRVVFLANPNNPTGTIIPASEVRRLHAGLPADCVFALDCAYAEFATGEYEDGLQLARDHANVVALRTFSKIYGLAAQRIGWAYAQPKLRRWAMPGCGPSRPRPISCWSSSPNQALARRRPLTRRCSPMESLRATWPCRRCRAASASPSAPRLKPARQRPRCAPLSSGPPDAAVPARHHHRHGADRLLARPRHQGRHADSAPMRDGWGRRGARAGARTRACR
jgi:hypothetical protein